MEVPEPRYVKTDDGVYIAYQVVGEGPVDISLQHAWLGGLELMWEDPFTAAFYEELASFARVILHDRRATGLSSRNVRPPNLETRVGDLLVVLDAVGSDRTVLLGAFEGGAPNALFASAYPARTHSLIWWGPSAQLVWAPDYPWGSTPDLVEHEMLAVREHWGTKAYGRNWVENNEILLGGGEFAPAPSSAAVARPRAAAAVPGPRDRHGGRRVPRDVRRPRSSRSMCKAILASFRELGIEVRAGCHTGEVELAGDDVRGIAVHIGARLASLAGGGEVLVSSTVKDLVAGSGLVFEDAGEHELKGVPDRWRLSGGASSEWWSSSASRPNESAGLGYGLGEERDHGHHAFRRDRHEPGMEEREASVADGVVARAPLTRRFEVLDLVVAVGEP